VSDTLLATKTHIPPVRGNLVDRPRLIRQLNEGIAEGCRLMLISAPAGYGKSTLLSEWVAQLDIPVAWLSLEKGENTPARFWNYFFTALSTIPQLRQVGIGESILLTLQSPRPPPLEELLAYLVNQLSQLDTCAVLVLDDLHIITESQIHRDLVFLIDHLPLSAAGLRLVIASRMDPPWPLARWRMRAELIELRSPDLRFSLKETIQFLHRVFQLSLSAQNVLDLQERTEGWIAGLQMAAVSIQGRLKSQGLAGASRFIESFAGSNRFILDYLMEEVVGQQSEQIQDFLYNTSILEQLTAPLCDLLAGRQGSQAMLDQIEQANLFLIPLDDEKHWYRYHHLFRDLLQRSLLTAQPELALILHHKASQWFKDAGFPEEAIAHAFDSGNMDYVASLIEQNAMQMIAQGKLHLLATWMERLPAEMVRTCPWLCIYWAWIRYYLGPRDRAEEYLRIAEDIIQSVSKSSPDGRQSKRCLDQTEVEKEYILGNIAAIRALCATSTENISIIMELAQKALELLPEMAVMRVVPYIIMGFAHHGMGNPVAAEQAYRNALAMAQMSDLRSLSVTATCYIGLQQVKQGKLHEAYDTNCDAMGLARGVGGELLDIAGFPMSQIGDILREWNELEKASEYITKSVEFCERWGHMDFLAKSYVILARLQFAQGDTHAANITIQKAEQVIRREKVDPYIVCWLDEIRLQLWLSEGNLAEAVHWVQMSGLSPDGELNYLHDLHHINLARVLVAEGEMKPSPDNLLGAQDLLNRLLNAARQAGWIHDEIKILILEAFVNQAKHDNEEALKIFSRALTLAEPRGYFRLFIDEGKPMSSLLHRAVSKGITVGYASKLLAAMQAGERVVFEPGHSGLVEPLSERELQVLRLLDSALTNEEIGRQLYVSVNTIRTHIRNIYAKLGVNRRGDAVLRAKELNF
jgi:LuxR family transcriptional regulator, maltose regulon positive regulatory protein